MLDISGQHSDYVAANIAFKQNLIPKHALREFLSKKLKKHEKKVSSLLINYFSSRKDYESVMNLPNLYERNKEWKDIINVLTLDNIGLIVNKSKSFSEIKRQINYGYKAAINLNNAYSDLLNFSLYRSTILSLQKSDSNESQIKAYISIGKRDYALSLISGIAIKEERYRMLIFYAKTCKVKDLEIEEIVIEEIKEYSKDLDVEYLNENANDIIIGLAYFLPEVAVSTIEKISGLRSEDNSLEWLVNYAASIIDKNNKSHDDGSITLSEINHNDYNNSFLEKFKHSIGIGINKVEGKEIIDHIETYENYNDRLFLLKNWITNNAKSDNIYGVVEYAIKLLVHNSAAVKPTTTVLLDIISPLKYISNEEHAKKIIDRVEELMISINSPTGDKIRLEITLIERTIYFDYALANDKIILLEKFINELNDYSVKVNAIADVWVLIKKIERDEFLSIDELILDEKLIIDKLFFTINELLQTTSDHYLILRTTISKIAKYDFALAVNIVNLFNTERRRLDGLLKCIDVYTEKHIKTGTKKL